MKIIHWIALILVIVGALNWGLVGFFKMDIVSLLLGANSAATRIVFGLVGLAGLWCIGMLKHLCRCCDADHSHSKKK